MNTTETTTSHKDIIREVCDEGWTMQFPEWVREAFVRALKTETLPPYARTHLDKALRVATAINERLNKQEAQAQNKGRTSTGAERSRQRKAEKRAKDREIRMRMKSPKGQKS